MGVILVAELDHNLLAMVMVVAYAVVVSLGMKLD